MVLHPEVEAVLGAMAARSKLFELDPPAARAALAALPPAGQPVDVAEVLELEVPGPAGDLPARVYRPCGANDGMPVLLWLHGGGWTFGSVERSDRTIRAVAALSGALTLAVDYRLAPEDPFPAAVDDAWAALRWWAANAGRYGGDGGRLAVGGDSAGANLAAVACLLARDAGGPPIRLQALVYPICDFDFDTPSYQDNATGFFLTRQAVQSFADHYVPDAESRADWRAAPARAPDLHGLPEAVIVTAEHDPLRDDGARYAARLRAADVPVAYTCHLGMIHGFFSMTAALGAARAAQAELGAALRHALAAPTSDDPTSPKGE